MTGPVPEQTMDPHTDEPRGQVARLSPRAIALLVVYGATLLMLNPGRPWALTFHETNFAQPAREFLQTGDWLVPRIAGVPLWDKPPLMHWAIALAMSMFGTEAEWAVRLPTTIATIFTALVIARLATRWHGPRIGLLAGLIQLTSLYVLIQGRLAEADMLLCAFVTASIAALAAATVEPPASGRWRRALTLAYFGGAGLAFLAKGPLGLALVGGAGGMYALLERRRDVWRFLLDPAGWALMVLLVLGWPVAAALNDRGLLEVWWDHNVGRFRGELGGRKDPFFYAYTIPWLLLPWTPFVLHAIREGLRHRPHPRLAAEARLLGSWFAAGFLLLSVAAWKHKHYAIPLLPPLSIVAACGLSRFAFDPPRRLITPVRLVAIGLVGLGVLAAPIAWAASLPTVASMGLVTIIAGAGLALASEIGSRRGGWHGLSIGFGTLWLVFVVSQGLVMPRFDLYRAQAELARRTESSLPPGADLSVVEIPDPQITFYLPMPLKRHDRWESFASRLVDDPSATDRVYYVLGPRSLFARLERLGRVRAIDRSSLVHPKKVEADRLTTFEVSPDRARLASLNLTTWDAIRR